MELELKMLRQNDIPFIPVTHERGVIVKDVNGNETTLDKLLIKDSDLSLKIENGRISHVNQVTAKPNKGYVKVAHDEYGHITDSEEFALSNDFKETTDNEIIINYNQI